MYGRRERTREGERRGTGRKEERGRGGRKGEQRERVSEKNV